MCIKVNHQIYSAKGKHPFPTIHYTGLVLPDENIGKMDSKGIEFQAGYHENFGQLYFSFNGNVTLHPTYDDLFLTP